MHNDENQINLNDRNMLFVVIWVWLISYDVSECYFLCKENAPWHMDFLQVLV